MKKGIFHIILFAFVLPGLVKSQEAIQFSQIHKVLEYVNPAYNFSKNNPGGSTIYRNQWAGVKGAPKTYAFNFHYPFQYQNIGMGTTVIREEVGLRNTTRIDFNMDIGVRSTEKSFLSAGLLGGIKHNYYNTEDAVAVNYEEVVNLESTTSPFLGGGLMYFTRQIQLGGSFFMIIPEKESFSFRKSFSLNAHASYYVRLSRQFALKPVILYKQNTTDVWALDVGSFLLYRDMVWLGVSYRPADAAIISLDIKINDKIRLGYSYDISLKKSMRMAGNTSELRLEFELNHPRRNEYLSMRNTITN